MITFPNAKINLGLNIIKKRPDGYHDLETVFYPVPIEDALEITPHKDKEKGGKCRLHPSGMPVEGCADDNLVVKAYRLLDADFDLPPIDVHLYKHIPSGAGLGGGSADAAFMLKMLDKLFALHLTTEQLEGYASRLGADCAFFIGNRPVFAEGIGNVFTPITLSLEGYWIGIVKPDVFVSTREAFAGIVPRKPEVSLKDVVRQPVETWRELMANDFEESIFRLHPAIAEVKQEMYRLGAVYASMSGSGSAVYGLFREEVAGFAGHFHTQAPAFFGKLQS